MSRNEYYNGVLHRIKIIVDSLKVYDTDNESKETISMLRDVLLKCLVIREHVLYQIGSPSDAGLYVDLKYLMPCVVNVLRIKDLFKLLSEPQQSVETY